jgi:hypothetical protein
MSTAGTRTVEAAPETSDPATFRRRSILNRGTSIGSSRAKTGAAFRVTVYSPNPDPKQRIGARNRGSAADLSISQGARHQVTFAAILVESM